MTTNSVNANQLMCALQHVCLAPSAAAYLQLGMQPPQPPESTTCAITSCLHRQIDSAHYLACNFMTPSVDHVCQVTAVMVNLTCMYALGASFTSLCNFSKQASRQLLGCIELKGLCGKQTCRTSMYSMSCSYVCMPPLCACLATMTSANCSSFSAGKAEDLPLTAALAWRAVATIAHQT